MKIIYRLLVLMLALLMLVSASACGEVIAQLKPYDEDFTSKKIQTGIVDSNENYTMSWDAPNKRVLITDKADNVVWSNVPKKALENDPRVSGKKNNPQVESLIHIKYYDSDAFVERKAYSHSGAVMNGDFSVQVVNKTIEITYNFKVEKISVTAEVELTENGISISVDPSKITEEGTNKITDVYIAPYMCSVPENSENSYIFVPSGSGALIYPDSPKIVKTSEEIYGKDHIVSELVEPFKTDSVRMAVYGMKDNDRGICAIIENGASAATIETISGDKNIGFTAVYPGFKIRGYDIIDEDTKNYTLGVVKIYSEPIINTVYKVSYNFLKGDESQTGYLKMAELYRKHLFEVYGKNEQKLNEKPYMLELVGGVNVTKYFLGVPYSTLYPTTTLEQANEIVSSFKEKFKTDFSVNCFGFGESGVDIQKLAGGFKVSSKLGNKKDIRALNEYCETNKLPLYFEYDLARFSEGSSFVTIASGSALTPSGKRGKITEKQISVPIRTDKTFNLLKHSLYEKAIRKLIKTTDKAGINGICISTISSLKYSDYSEYDSYASLGLPKTVSTSIEQLKNAKKTVLSSSANDYAAILSDAIKNAPLSSSRYDSYSVDIPFYQIVLKGYVDMYSENILTAKNQKQTVLKAIESGCGVLMAVTKEYDLSILTSSYNEMYAADTQNAINTFEGIIKDGYLEYFEAVKNAKIVSHEIVSKDVRKVTYDNGAVVTVDYASQTFSVGKEG